MITPRIIRSAVVTGASGMIGANLVRLLAMKGVRVTAYVSPDSAKKKNLQEDPLVTVREADLRNYAEIMPDSHADAFFHLAWMAPWGEGRNDCLLQTENIRCSIEAALLAERYGCSVFVGAGSQAEYKKANMALGPDSVTEPDTGYGMAKLAAGRMTRLTCRQYGIAHVWTRFFSVYGPGDNRYTMVMSGILSMLAGKVPDYTAGDQLWDYLYCEDAARAMLLCAEYGVDGLVYCIGSGSVRPLKEYIAMICGAVGKGAHAALGARPYFPNQVMHLEADIRTLVRDTGFCPEVPFEEGIRKTVAWAKTQFTAAESGGNGS